MTTVCGIARDFLKTFGTFCDVKAMTNGSILLNGVIADAPSGMQKSLAITSKKL